MEQLPPSEAGFEAHTVRHRYGPVELSLHIGDPMGALWYEEGWPDVPELEFLPRYQTRPGATVVNFGAHQGVYALMLAHSVGPDGRVIAIEANGYNVDVLRENCRLNGVDNIEAVHAAVGERSGWILFGSGNNGQVDPGGRFEDSRQVPAVTIDAITERYGRPAMLFIDIEGYECQALRGGPATLATRPDVFVEVHVGVGLEVFGGTIDELLGFFPEEEYELFGSNELDRHPRPFVGERRQIVNERFFLTAIARNP